MDTKIKNRIWELDLLRALVIIGVLIDHLLLAFYTTFPAMFVAESYLAYPFLQNLYTIGGIYKYSIFRNVIRFVGLTILALLIGINTHFSKNNWKRSLLLILVGLAMSSVFLLGHHLNMTNYSIFGTITCYGVCLLIYCIVHAIFSRFKDQWKWICLGIGLFILFSWRYIRYEDMILNDDTKFHNFWLIYNGCSHCFVPIEDISELDAITVFKVIVGLRAFGTDYLGIFPTLGYLFIGAFIGLTLYKDKKSFLHYFDKEGKMSLNERFNTATRGLLFFGQKSIFFYLGHQVVYIGLMLIVGGLILGIPFSFI